MNPLQPSMKALVFFDSDELDREMDRNTRQAFSKYGAYVRQAAKGLIRPARQKRLDELTEEERQSYETRKRIAAEEGGPRPKRPTASAKEGEAFRSQTGKAKKAIFFAYDRESMSVVAGFALLPGLGGAKVLQFLDEKFPVMGPAEQAVRPQLNPLLRDWF